jgi:hypothetical protein
MTDNRQAPWGVRLSAELQDKFLAKIEAEKMTKSQGFTAAIEQWLGIEQESIASLDERFSHVWESIKKTEELIESLSAPPKPKAVRAVRATQDSQELFMTYAAFYNQYGFQTEIGKKYDALTVVLAKLKEANLDDQWEYQRSEYRFYKK